MIASSPLQQFLQWEKEIPGNIFLRQPFNGQWKTWTWNEAGTECRKMAAALQSLGLPPKSHIAILSKNCAHWIMADIAIMMAGYISIPIYPSLSSHSIQPILEHSDTAAIIVGKLDDYTEQQNGIPKNIIKISIEACGIAENNTWEKMVATNKPLLNTNQWKEEDVLTIIYTSGTTGNPKGVMHTTSSVDSVMQMVTGQLKLQYNLELFSYLPLSHIAERLAVEFNGLYRSGTLSFAESLATFAANLNYIQPHCFLAVPRIWAKFQEGILKKMPQKKLDLLLSLPIINSIIKKSIRKKLGLSRAVTILSGAAPISKDLQIWFRKLGIIITQAYGMTEDCVYSHIETPVAQKIGSVGKPLPGLLTRIAADGELREKSKGNMKGYYKEPQLTAEAFDEDGYLKTGDIGEYDHDGFLFITGRIKDQFKTDKGKYISPTPIELLLAANTDIENVCVVGMGIPQPIALITLSENGKQKTAAAIIESLSAILTAINASLESHEELEKAVIMKENWDVANGLLTPSLKVKRNQVEKIHQSFYPEWFNKKEMVIWE